LPKELAPVLRATCGWWAARGIEFASKKNPRRGTPARVKLFVLAQA
jgi:hypothetical protein